MSRLVHPDFYNPLMEMCVLIRVKASCMHITCVNRNMLMDSRISISGLRLRLDLLGSRIPDGWDRIAFLDHFLMALL